MKRLKSAFIIVFRLMKLTYLSNKKNTLKSMVSIGIIFTVLLTFSFFLITYEHTTEAVFKYSEYDVLVQPISNNDLDLLKKQPNIQKVFIVRYMIADIKALKEKRSIEMNLYLSDSFKDINLSYFSDKLLICKDTQLINNEDENPIIIDYTMAKKLGVKLGDILQVPISENGNTVKFKVAAIYEPLNPEGQHSAAALWTGKQREFFNSQTQEEFLNARAFVKTKNKEKAIEFLTDNITNSKGYITISRDDQLKTVIKSLEFTPPTIIITSLLGFIIFVLVIIREQDKKILVNQKNFAILNSLGCPKYLFILYLTIEMIIFQIPVLILSTLIVKFIIYDKLLTFIYLPLYVLFDNLIFILILQIVSCIISGLVFYYKLKRIDLTLLLCKE